MIWIALFIIIAATLSVLMFNSLDDTYPFLCALIGCMHSASICLVLFFAYYMMQHSS